jgi:hypothetical protein
MGNTCSCLQPKDEIEQPRKESVQEVHQHYSNGDSYKGKLEEGVRQGQGTYTYKKGGRYQGEFVDGHPSGKGEFYYNNGEMYQGEW